MAKITAVDSQEFTSLPEKTNSLKQIHSSFCPFFCNWRYNLRQSLHAFWRQLLPFASHFIFRCFFWNWFTPIVQKLLSVLPVGCRKLRRAGKKLMKQKHLSGVPDRQLHSLNGIPTTSSLWEYLWGPKEIILQSRWSFAPLSRSIAQVGVCKGSVSCVRCNLSHIKFLESTLHLNIRILSMYSCAEDESFVATLRFTNISTGTS